MVSIRCYPRWSWPLFIVTYLLLVCSGLPGGLLLVSANDACPDVGSTVDELATWSVEYTEPKYDNLKERYSEVLECLGTHNGRSCDQWYAQGDALLQQGALGVAASLLSALTGSLEKCYTLHVIIGRAYESGRHVQLALESYNNAVDAKPSSFLARYHRGVFFHRIGRYPEAEQDLQVACSTRVDRPTVLARADCLYFHGNVYKELKQLDEAKSKFEEALELNGDHQKAKTNLGILHYQLGNISKALALLKEAIALNTSYLPPRLQLGAMEYNSGRFEEALKTFKAIANENIKHGQAVKYLSATYEQLGHYRAGIKLWTRHIKALNETGNFAPGLGKAMASKASLQMKAKQWQGAMRTVQEGALHMEDILNTTLLHAENMNSSRASAQQMLGELVQMGANILEEQKLYGDAEMEYERCHQLGNDKCLYQLGLMLRQIGEVKDAISVLTRAHQAWEGRDVHKDILLLLADLSVVAGDLEAARRIYDAGLRADHTCVRCLVESLFLQHRLLRWEGYEAKFKNTMRLARKQMTLNKPVDLPPFHMLYYNVSQSDYLDIARAVSRHQQHLASEQPPPTAPLPGPPSGGMLRVGLVSGDFGNTPTAYLLRAVLEEIKSRYKSSVYTIAYALTPSDDSKWRRHIVSAVSKFRSDLPGNLTELATLIRQDNLDVAINLDTHLRETRANVLCAMRVARTQVAYLGYPGSTGAPFIDYLVTDPVVSRPPLAAQQISEKGMFLPASFQANSHARNYPHVRRARPSAGTPFTFCNLNQLIKIDPPQLHAWSKILAAVPDAKLFLMATPEDAVDNLKLLAAVYGIDPKRLIFARRTDPGVHVDRIAHTCHLFLDNWRVNAHTTAADTLWAGVPILTVAGHAFPSRIAASQLQALVRPLLSNASTQSTARDVLDTLIAPDLQTYVDTAIRLAQDPLSLDDIRETVLALVRGTRGDDGAGSTGLFDTRHYVHGLVRGLHAAVEVSHSSGRHMHVF